MRDELRKSKNQVSRFNATFSRFGRVKDIVLLKDIYDIGQNNTLVTDHVWIKLSDSLIKFFESLVEGDEISFTAGVGKYYANGKLGSVREDYKLTKLKKIRLVNSVNGKERS